MTAQIRTCGSQPGAASPLSRENAPCAHYLQAGEVPKGVGWKLTEKGRQEPLFIISGHIWLPGHSGPFCESAPLLMAQTTINDREIKEVDAVKTGYAAAVITLSDKGSQGLREDESGLLCLKLLKDAIPICFSRNFLIADEAETLRGLMAELALTQKYDLICTSGGTGVGPRDITPQTTAKLLDLELPGFMQAMMAKSLEATPRAIISRAVAGIIGKCMVINLPGSPKAAAENLSPLLPALEHALAKLNGDPADCGAQRHGR